MRSAARRTPVSAASCSIAARSIAQQKIEFLSGLDVFSVPTVVCRAEGIVPARSHGVRRAGRAAAARRVSRDARANLWRGSRRSRRYAEPRGRALCVVEVSSAPRRARTARIRRRARALQRSADRPTACSRCMRGRCADASAASASRIRLRTVKSRCCRTCRCRSRRATPPRSWDRRAAARARFSTFSGRSSRRRPAP